jgi:hypothetical protein
MGLIDCSNQLQGISMDIYISTDIETDGPIPGENSMLSLGAAAFLKDKTLLSTFSINFEALPAARQDDATMQWWKSQPKAWEACRSNPVAPSFGIQEFSTWIDGLGGKPVCVAYPVGFDFLFVYWYLIKFTGRSPFGHSAIDIRSYAMGLLRSDYGSSSKKHMPKQWLESESINHVALDDAIAQGRLFCNMLAQ